jgi:hypothetical protein
MFVYIWKDANGIPFYVGLTKSVGRTNPKNGGGRNWLCRVKLQEIGHENVVVEIRHVETPEQGAELEQKLITEIGRVQLGTGPLTNLKEGGGWHKELSEEGRESLRQSLLRPDHPIRSPEARAKHKARMLDPETRAKFSGENNAAKRPEVRAKIKAKWADPEYRAARIKEKQGRKIHSEASKEARRQRLLDPSNPMREQHKLLNSDPIIREKRNAALRSPESRAKRSEAMKLSWAKRKGLA